MSEVKKLVEEVRKSRAEFGLSIPSPIKENSIKNFSKEFTKQFNISPPKEYLDFLNLCDGLAENGYIVYSSFNHQSNGVIFGIFELNEVWHNQDPRFRKYIYYAVGDQDIFVFDTEKKEYQLQDRYCGDVIKTFSSFDKMIVDALNKMLG